MQCLGDQFLQGAPVHLPARLNAYKISNHVIAATEPIGMSLKMQTIPQDFETTNRNRLGGAVNYRGRTAGTLQPFG
jgi:hypothetical protein